MRISFSALEAFENCPKRYEFQYIDKIKAPKSKEQLLGTLVHSALRYFHSTIPRPKLNQLLDYFKEHWISEPAIWKDKEEEKAFFQEGLQMLKNYYQKNYSAEFTIVDLEANIEAEMPESDHPEAEKHTIVGRVDRIDKLSENFFEIIDYKTARRMPSQEKTKQSLQLGIYALGFEKRWPHLKEAKLKLSLCFLKHSEKLSFIKTREFLESTKEKTLEIIQKIKKGYFPPLPGPLCDYCPYREICPMWKHMYQKEKTPEEKEVIKMVKEYLNIKKTESQNKEKLATLRREINKYLEAKGNERIFSDEGYITRIPQIREEYDFSKVKEILEPLGVWQEVLEVNKSKFKALLKKLPKETLEKIKKEAKLKDKEFKTFKASFSKKPASFSEEEQENET